METITLFTADSASEENMIQTNFGAYVCVKGWGEG